MATTHSQHGSVPAAQRHGCDKLGVATRTAAVGCVIERLAALDRAGS
jgi:hypothetical protein